MTQDPNPAKESTERELLQKLNKMMEDLDPTHTVYRSIPPVEVLERLKFRYPHLREVIAILIEKRQAQDHGAGKPLPPTPKKPRLEKNKPVRKVVTPEELLKDVDSKDLYAKAVAEGLTGKESPREEMQKRSRAAAARDEEAQVDSGAPSSAMSDEPIGPGVSKRPPIRKVVTLSELLEQIDEEDTYAKEIIEGLAEDERNLVEMRIRSKVERLRAELNLDSAQKVTMEYLLDKALEGGRDLVEKKFASKDREYKELDEKFSAKDRFYQQKDEQYGKREQELKSLTGSVAKLFEEKVRGKLTTVEHAVDILVKALRHARRKMNEHRRIGDEHRDALAEAMSLLENRRDIDADFATSIVSFKDLFFQNFSQFFVSVEDRVGWTNFYEGQLAKFVEKKSTEIDETLGETTSNEETEEIAKDFRGFYMAVEVLLQVANYYREICVNARQEANSGAEAKEHLVRFIQLKLPEEKIDDILSRAGEELMPELLALEKDIDDSERKPEKDLRIYYQKSEKKMRQLQALLQEFEIREPAIEEQKDEISKLTLIYSRFVQNANELAGAASKVEDLRRRNEELTAKRRSLTLTLVSQFEDLRKLFDKSKQYIGMDRSMSSTNITKAIESIPDEFKGVHSVFEKLLLEIDTLQEKNRSIIGSRDKEMKRLMELARRKTRAFLPKGAERELAQLRTEVEQLRKRNHDLKRKVIKRVVRRIRSGAAPVAEPMAEMSRRLHQAQGVWRDYCSADEQKPPQKFPDIDLAEESALPLLLGRYIAILTGLERSVEEKILPLEKELAKKFERAGKRLPEELKGPNFLVMHGKVEKFLRKAEEKIAQSAKRKEERIASFIESNRDVLTQLLNSGFDPVSTDERLERLQKPAKRLKNDTVFTLLDYTSLRRYVTLSFHGEEDDGSKTGFGTVDLSVAEKERHRLVATYGYEGFDEFHRDIESLTADLEIVKNEGGLNDVETAFLARFRYKRLATVMDKLAKADNPKALKKLYTRAETPDVEGDILLAKRIDSDREDLLKAKAELFTRARKLNPAVRSEKKDFRRAVGIIDKLVGLLSRNLEQMTRLESEKKKLMEERNLVSGIETFDDFHEWLKERVAEVDEIETEPREKTAVCEAAAAILGKKFVEFPIALAALGDFVDNAEFAALRKDLLLLGELRGVVRTDFHSGSELRKAIRTEIRACKPYFRDITRLQARKSKFAQEILELGQ
jgi:hypothetical protein